MPTKIKSIPKSTPRDVFLHLLVFVALYASAVTFITLLFQYINTWYPDPLDYYTSVANTIRYSASFLVVMFPVYLLISWIINRDFVRDPARKEIRVRKWLVYLTLFVSALTVIGDVITLVYNFLGGEFTIRFFLKIIVVLMTAAAIFGYYYWDLHKNTKAQVSKILPWLASVVVFGTIIVGFFMVGSPAHQRSLNFDQKRVSDLQTIQSQTLNYWQQKQKLPAQLSDLADSISGFAAPMDPENGQAYEYRVRSDLNFELCASFNLPSSSQTTPYAQPAPVPFGNDPYSQNWTHTAGRVCFERTIDPQLYKTPPPVPFK